MLLDFILNLPSPSHKYSSCGETFVGFGFGNLEAQFDILLHIHLEL